jgi:hypothetical protein
MREIDDSMRRVRAAKRGASVTTVSPSHGINFFLPDQRSYFPTLIKGKEDSNMQLEDTLNGSKNIPESKRSFLLQSSLREGAESKILKTNNSALKST